MGSEERVQRYIWSPGGYRCCWDHDYPYPSHLWTSTEALGWTTEVLGLEKLCGCFSYLLISI